MTDEEAVSKSLAMFEARKAEFGFDGFEVWQLSRMVLQYPPRPEGRGDHFVAEIGVLSAARMAMSRTK